MTGGKEKASYKINAVSSQDKISHDSLLASLHPLPTVGVISRLLPDPQRSAPPGGGPGALLAELWRVRGKEDSWLGREAWAPSPAGSRPAQRAASVPSHREAVTGSHDIPPPPRPSTGPRPPTTGNPAHSRRPASCTASGRRVYPRCMVGPSPWTTWSPAPAQALPRGGRSERGGGGGMHQASARAAPLASPDYYERLGRLQHGLRDRYGLPEAGAGKRPVPRVSWCSAPWSFPLAPPMAPLGLGLPAWPQAPSGA